MDNKVDRKSKNKKKIIDNIKNNLLEDLIKESGIKKEDFDEKTFQETLNYLYNSCAINLTAINRKIRFINQKKDKENTKKINEEVIDKKEVLEKEKINPNFIEIKNKTPKNSIFQDMFGMKKKQ